MKRERGSDQQEDRGREQRQRLIDRAKQLEAEAATVDDLALRAQRMLDAEIYRAAAIEEGGP